MVKAILTGNKDPNSKNYLDSPKDGFIQKKKNQKFKQTPAGKVALINGSKARNNNSSKQQNQPKKTNLSKDDKKEQESAKKKLMGKKLMLVEEEDDTDSEIDEDINEGVVLGDQSIMAESDNSSDQEESDDDDESEEEKNVPNILGNSLADESDDDDEDYEEEEEKEGTVKVNKGVEMFKGLKQASSLSDSFNDSSDNSTVEQSLTQDTDEDSEDEEEDGDDDDDDDDDDEDEDLEEEEDDTLDSSEIDEEEDEDDDDDESEDEEDADESALSLKALMENTIDDDEDDEDFVEPGDNDEDDDISDEDEDEVEDENNALENSQKNKNAIKNEDATLEQMKTDKRTVFVGNLPKDAKRAELKKLFKKFGTIDTIRLRGIVSKSLNVPKKVAVITKDVHPKLKSVYAYILFASEDSAKAALSMNGTVFEGNYLRVDIADKSEKKYDTRKSVFLGNLSFNIDDNIIIKHFEECGEIESVRVIRDNKTGIGKGFGYINFNTEDAVTLALELDGTTILNREVRVKPNVEQHNKKGKHGKRSHSAEDKNVAHKRSKNNAEVAVPVRNRQNAVKRITEKKKNLETKQTSPQQKNVFQGHKADANKKKKKNKLEKKKAILAEKLTAKSKKPSK